MSDLKLTDITEFITKLLSNANPLLDTDETAFYLKTTPTVIRQSRVEGKLFGRTSPEYIRMGDRKISYERKTLECWIAIAPRGIIVGSEKVDPSLIEGGGK